VPAEKRGLPPANELRQFVADYLGFSRDLFPALAQTDLLPEPTPENVDRLVSDFEARHRSVLPDHNWIAEILLAAGIKPAGGYGRVSARQSNPKSLNDQAHSCQRRACTDGRFIPLQYFFLDFVKSGILPRRPGYRAFRGLLDSPGHTVEAAYFDDFNRGGRNVAEWHRLLAQAKRLRLSLVCVEQNLDLTNQTQDIWLHVLGMVASLQLTTMSQNVLRGIRGAIGRGFYMGQPGFGYTTRPMYDAGGRQLLTAKNKVRRELCIDPVTSKELLEAVDRLVNRAWTLKAIVKDFNRRKVDGWDGWAISTVKRALRNVLLIGVWTFGKSEVRFSEEAGKYVEKKKSRADYSEYQEHLQLLSFDLWLRLQDRLDAIERKHPNTKRSSSRNEICPTTLFSGTLFCGYCRSEIKLFRSAGQQQQMVCNRGRDGRDACQLNTSKSVKAIEDSLLPVIRDLLFDDARHDRLLQLCNLALSEEAANLLPEEKELRSREQSLKRKIDRLTQRIADADDLTWKHVKKALGEAEHEFAALKPQLKALAIKPPLRDVKITREAMLDALQNLREVLGQDPLMASMAGLALRELTGPILVTTEPVPNTKKSNWIAEFTPQYQGLLRRSLGVTDLTAGALATALPPEQKIRVVIKVNWGGPKRKIAGRLHGGHLTPEARKAIEDLYRSGMKINDVVKTAGCSRTTAYLIRRELERRDHLNEQEGAA